jgi:hypothetical protein
MTDMATAKKSTTKVTITSQSAPTNKKVASNNNLKKGFSKADLHKALREYFGFEEFKGNQEAIILTC